MEDTAVSSGADLASSFTPSSSSSPSSSSDTGISSPAQGADASSASPAEFDFEEPGSPDAPNGEEDVNYDALNDQGNPDGEAVDDDTAPPADAATEDPAPAQAAKPADQAQPEELPEGVRKGKDRNGKEGYWLNPNRYETFHGAHKAIRDIEGIIGEPVTTQAIAYRDRALMGQEKLYSDLLSGDPDAQGSLVDHFFQESQRAQQEGEIAGDPMVSFTTAFYERLQNADPQAYAALRARAAADLVDEMYAEAAQASNRSLWLSAQHFDKILGRDFRKEADMANLATNAESDQFASIRAENQQLRAQLHDRAQGNAAEQHAAWMGSVNQSIGKSLSNDVITPALASVAGSYKDFPETFAGVQKMLHSKIMDGFKDPGFRGKIGLLMANASRAPSAQKRAAIAEQVVAMHTTKARQIAEHAKRPILAEAARGLKAQSDRTHQRRQDAQQQRVPSGGNNVRTSLAPAKGMDFENASPASLARSLDGLLAR